MSLPLILALLTLPALLYAAYWAHQRDQQRLAIAAFIAAPLCMAAVYVAAGHVHLPEPSAAPATVSAPSAPAQTSGESAAPSGGRVADLRSKAEDARRAKRYSDAAALFKEITQAAPFDPDGWADLGDAQAAASGGDLNAGKAAIDRALELDAEHAKALWLKASLELQGQHYREAADLWRRLVKVLPADSSDAKIVQTNLEEAERLAGGTGKRP